MGAGQSLYQERNGDVSMSVEVQNVYIGAMSGMGSEPKSGPTESVNIRLWSCDSGDVNDASVNDYDVEGCDRHRSGAEGKSRCIKQGIQMYRSGVPTCNVASSR